MTIKNHLLSTALLLEMLVMILATARLEAANPSDMFLIATRAKGATGPMSDGAAFDGTNFLIGMQGDSSAGNNILAQLVSQAGSLVGPPIRVGRTGGTPGVAFDGTNYLLVWPDDTNPNDDDIYGQLIAPSGKLVGSPFAICTKAGRQAFHSLKPIIFGGTHYLVVWEDPRNGSSNLDIYGQLVSPSGALVSGEMLICTEPESQRDPSVDFNDTNYFVAWMSRRSGDPELWDTQGRFVSPSGVLGPVLQISQGPSPRINPIGLAAGGTNFLVAWNRDLSSGFPNSSVWDVYGRLVSGSGSFLGNEFPITTAAGSQVFAMIGFDGANYLVSWFDDQVLNTKFRFFTTAGQSVGQEFMLFTPKGIKWPMAVVGPFDGTRFLTLANLTEDASFINSDLYGAFVPGSTAPARLDFTNGRLPLTVTGVPGQNYVVQATPNMHNVANWSALATNNANSGTFSFTDTNTANFPQRFYRAVRIP